MSQTNVILNPQGQPARTTTTDCPQCGAGKEKRCASSGFGLPHPVCSRCGYEWIGEVFRG